MRAPQKRIRSLSRRQFVRSIFPRSKRVGRRLAMKASQTFGQFGYMHAQPAQGPAEEAIALVPKGHRLAPLVEAVRSGRAKFGIRELANVLDGPIDGPRARAALARAGLGLYSCRNGTVELRAVNPDAASVINARRCGTSRKGTSTRKLVEAFAPGPPVRRLGSERLLRAGVALAEWGLDSEDLLERKSRTHLRSSWQLS